MRAQAGRQDARRPHPTPTPTPTPDTGELLDPPQGDAGDGATGASTVNPNPNGKLSIAISLPSPTEDDRDNEDNDASTVEEGARAFFLLTASPAPQSGVTVIVTVLMCVTGEPFSDETGLRQKTIDVTASKTTFPFHIQSNDDQKDEDSGNITVELQADTGYNLVPGKTTTSVKVYDNDAPAGLRANGHLAVRGGDTNPSIGLRWNESGATEYDVWVQQQRCLPGEACEFDPHGLSTMVDLDVANTTEATLPGLTAHALYKLSVGSDEDHNWYRNHTNKRSREPADFSVWPEVWSEVAVYPTQTHPTIQGDHEDGSGTFVATIALHQFQTDGHLELTICNPPAPTSPPLELPADAAQPLPAGASVAMLEGIIEEWEGQTLWSTAGESNIIYSTLTRDTACPKPGKALGKFLYFVSPTTMWALCGDPDHRGCWSYDPTSNLVSPTGPLQFLMLRNTPRYQSSWLSLTQGNCTWLHWTLSHEVGHAYGLAHGKTLSSIMSYASVDYDVCGPTVYDTAAILAIYQSR